MSYDFLYEVDDAIATLTFNRPKVLNALTFEVYAQLRDLFDELQHDEAVKAVGSLNSHCSWMRRSVHHGSVPHES